MQVDTHTHTDQPVDHVCSDVQTLGLDVAVTQHSRVSPRVWQTDRLTVWDGHSDIIRHNVYAVSRDSLRVDRWERVVKQLVVVYVGGSHRQRHKGSGALAAECAVQPTIIIQNRSGIILQNYPCVCTFLWYIFFFYVRSFGGVVWMKKISNFQWKPRQRMDRIWWTEKERARGGQVDLLPDFQ